MMRIEAEGISVRLGSVDALRGVDFSADAGEIVGLIGPNGSGKTTLLRALANLRPADRGRVRYAGKSAAEVGAAELSRQIAYLAQGGEAYWPMRVEALVALGRLPHRHRFQKSAAADRAAVERALRAADIVALRERAMNQISGGERMRALLARALAVEAPMLLADEPVAALDPLHQLQVMELLRKKAAAGGGVVVVLHDLALAARFCDRLVLLESGRVLAAGSPAAVLTDVNVAAAFGVEVVRGEHEGAAFVLPWSPSEEVTGSADEQGFRDGGAHRGAS
jgi:iron complex transport system ATP-binding protein